MYFMANKILTIFGEFNAIQIIINLKNTILMVPHVRGTSLCKCILVQIRKEFHRDF